MAPSRRPPSPLGEMAALLTSALRRESCGSRRCAHLADGTARVLGIGEVDLDVILGPHLPGTVLGEAVA